MPETLTYGLSATGWVNNSNALGPPDAVYCTVSSTGTLLAVTIPIPPFPDNAIIDAVYGGVRWMTSVLATTISMALSVGDTTTRNLPLASATSTPANYEYAYDPALFTAAMLNTNKTLSFSRVGASGTMSVDAAWLRVVWHSPAPASSDAVKRWDGSAWVDAVTKRWGAGPVLTNACQNPSFETGTANWQTSGAGTTIAQDTTIGSVGTKSLKIGQTGGAAAATALHTALPTPFPAGSQVTVGFDYLIPVGSAATSLRMRFRDSVQAFIWETATITNFPVKDGAWHRIVYRTVVAATYMVNQFYFDAVGPVGPAFDFNIDAVMIVNTFAHDGSYFDGDTPDTSTYDYAWAAAANASVSTRSTLPSWIPATVKRYDGAGWV